MRMTCSCLRSHRRDASGIDTIELDIWTTLVPPNGFTAATIWADSAPPNARVFNRTAQFGVPLNVTLLSATTYLVRASRHSLTCDQYRMCCTRLRYPGMSPAVIVYPGLTECLACCQRQ